ncbi:MAG: ABC transporter ATP-binding protein [Clostridiales bacterium]|nr:ABC transporter ATP-binding protein [Clostridiales bacterium]
MIRIDGLSKRFKDVEAVKSVSLEIPKGELFALLGVNGAGKTTLIKMLCSLIKPTSGDAWIDGKSILTEPNAVKEAIGLSPQETAVALNLTVSENLFLMAGVQNLDNEAARVRINEMMETFSLSKVASRRASKLSGGWQRKLSLAMALVKEPKVLFLDEPTLGLDVIARRELWDEITKLKGRVTVILTTHYMEEAEALSDRIGVMKDGVLLETGSAKELIAKTGADKFEDAFIRIVRGEYD